MSNNSEVYQLSRCLLAPLAFLGFVSASVGVISIASPGDSCSVASLPELGNKMLVEKFPQWRVQKLDDLTAAGQGTWKASKYAEKCPGLAVGFFENKARLSYAFVLIPRDRRNNGFRFVVVSLNNKGLYQETILDKADGPINPQVIYTLPSGKYLDWTRTKSVELTLEGVQLEQMGVTATLFYWKDGRYHKLVVMD